MRVLFYLGHPAQFHFSKNVIKKLQLDGHEVKILLKTKDVLEDLVIRSGFNYENIQEVSRKKGIINILIASLKRTLKVLIIAHKFNADILVGTDSSIAQAAFLLRKVSITTLEDDYDVIKNLARLTYPFSSAIAVPSVCQVGKKYEKKKIPYFGYMKLAYLHPNLFIPNERIVEKYFSTRKYCIIRLAKLTAHHDIGIEGLNNELVHRLINIIECKGYAPFISSESELGVEFQKYQLKIHTEDIHHVLSFSTLLISDSQSMSVEAAMLGVPSIRFSDFCGRISVLEELEYVYGLTFGVKTNDAERLFQLTDQILSENKSKEVFHAHREKMLSEKIDVTAFFAWFIENYPESRTIMSENPEYQYNFK